MRNVRNRAWIGKKKPNVIKGKALNPSAATMARYTERLKNLVLKMTKETEKELKVFFREPHSKEYFAQDASVSSQARILMNALQRRFDDLFSFKAKGLSEEMINNVDDNSAASLKISLKELSGGLTLKTDVLTGELNEVLTASIAENVNLIKSIPAQYIDGVQGAVMRSITTGRGLADLVPYLQKHEGVTLRRAKNIATDQTRKAFSSINRVRMKKMGVKHFEWLHTGGSQHPRKLHQTMSGNIYDFDNPPIIDERTKERGFPGQLVNCACRMLPVISFDTGENDE